MVRAPSLVTAPPKKNKRKNYQVQFVLPIYSQEHGQTPSGQSLKENPVLPAPTPSRASSCEAILLCPEHNF
ncbi:hypothetical protein LEMLEM_LOCUS16921 [Lemmus lemmus]